MRNVIDFNSDWLFTKNTDSSAVTLPNEAERIALPHTWNGTDGQDGGNDYYRGKCYYYKKISSDEFPADEKVFLEINGANSSAEVFLDGKSLAVHHGGYSAFRVDLTEHLKSESLLCVSVDNSPNDFVYPQMADFTFYGGLYRNVNIITVPNTHFCLTYYGAPGITVTPKIEGDVARVKIEAFVTNAGEGQSVVFEINDGDTPVGQVKTAAKNAVCEILINNVHLWNGTKDPHLYTAKATLIDKNSNEADCVITDFGCRYFRIDAEKGFFLNGKSYPLRGVARHQDRPVIGNALTQAHHAEDVELICEMGANTVRLAHYQHAREFYDLCDRKGLIIWAEIPYISKHMPKGCENTESQMRELICQNYNHPSIALWGLSNEITMNGADNQSLYDNHVKLNNLAHELDPTRLTTQAVVSMCSPDNKYVAIPDAVSYNHYFGWYGGNVFMYKKWFDEFHRKHPDIPVGLSEYGCEALNWHTSAPEQGDYTEEYQSYYHEEVIKQIIDCNYLWATHVWNMFDFAADARNEGGENGMNHKGLVSFDRKYKKDAFYAYKAWLSDEKFVHICSKRYVDRVEDETFAVVYSNCDSVELFANGESVGRQERGKYPFYHFTVKNSGETKLCARCGSLSDESIIRKVDTPNPGYVMKEEEAVINWFEIDAPAGYFSVNDTLGSIIKTFKGKLFVLQTLLKVKKKLSSGNGERAAVAGFSINKTMIDMAKGFTVKRMLTMAGKMFTKEDIIGINIKLNHIKKK